MFVEDNDTIDVKVYYKPIRGKRYIAFTESELKKLNLMNEEKDKYAPIIFVMREMNWGLFNELQSSGYIKYGEDESSKFDIRLFKENKLNKLVVAWDIENEGSPIPVSQDALRKLAWSIGEAILRGYDEVSFMDEDESHF